MHSIHKPLSDLDLYRPQPVNSEFFTPIIRDLTTRNLRNFNFSVIRGQSYPQVLHKLGVNYIRVTPEHFRMISGMSQGAKFKTQEFGKFQATDGLVAHREHSTVGVGLNRVR